jgi:hypothetical protein
VDRDRLYIDTKPTGLVVAVVAKVLNPEFHAAILPLVVCQHIYKGAVPQPDVSDDANLHSSSSGSSSSSISVS